MANKIYALSRDASDIDNDLSWTLYRLGDAVEGILDIFNKQMTSLLEGLLPFFKFRDQFEPKFVDAAGKGAEGAKTEVHPLLENANNSLKGSLLELGLSMAKNVRRQRNDLQFALRQLPTTAVSDSEILSLVTELPERILNFLSYLRIYFVTKAPNVFDVSVKAEEVQVNFRQFFLDSLTFSLDPLFEGIWNLLTQRLNVAVRLTLIDKFKKPILPAITALLDGLQKLVPDAINSFVNLPEMNDTVVDSLLGAIADKLFRYFKRKIESHIFAEAPLTQEEIKATEEKKKKDKEEREKQEKAKKDFDNP